MEKSLSTTNQQKSYTVILRSGKDITVHHRYIPQVVLDKGFVNIKDCRSFVYWVFDSAVAEGDVIVHGERVFRVNRHRDVPDSVKAPFAITGMYMKFNLTEIENVTEGHVLYSEDYSFSNLQECFGQRQAQYLQSVGDKEEYLNNLFWCSEYLPIYSQQVIMWYNDYIFNMNMLAIDERRRTDAGK